MEHNGSASNAGKIHQNRLSSVTEDEDQDAALTIVTVLDRVATVVDSVQASQKRIEERHRAMENAIKSVQIDLLKLSQSHSNTGYIVSKLFEKTRKVSAHIKDVKARVEKQQVHVTKVETKQEEIMKKNKFRVVIFQENIRCPSSLSVVKDRSLPENQEEDEEVFDPPIDLSSDEEYYVEESRSAKFRKSGKEHIDHIKKAFSKENMQKTRQNFDKKVSGIRTRIVTPERRERLRQSGERLRQSGERLRQSGERFKKSISNAAPSKEAFKIRSLRKPKDPKAGGQEGDRGMGVDIIAGSLALGPIHEFHPDEFNEAEKEVAKVGYIPQEGGDPPPPEPLKVTFKPQSDPFRTSMSQTVPLSVPRSHFGGHQVPLSSRSVQSGSTSHRQEKNHTTVLHFQHTELFGSFLDMEEMVGESADAEHERAWAFSWPRVDAFPQSKFS